MTGLKYPVLSDSPDANQTKSGTRKKLKYPIFTGTYPQSKVCPGCDRKLRPAEKHFSKNRRNVDGLQEHCKTCNRHSYLNRRDRDNGR